MGGPRAKLNWLCFLAAKRHRNIHIYVIYKHIRQFCPNRIGFVFSNEHKGIRHMGIGEYENMDLLSFSAFSLFHFH